MASDVAAIAKLPSIDKAKRFIDGLSPFVIRMRVASR
jgi:hypothetical protein